MITIYQILLSNEDIRKANAEGFRAVPKVDAKTWMGIGARKWMADYAKYYEPTMTVDTDDLELAFEATNLWNHPDKIKRVARGHSSSVGDIFVKDGDCYVVDSFGFAKLGPYEMIGV
jgi:hypothetical protein